METPTTYYLQVLGYLCKQITFLSLLLKTKVVTNNAKLFQFTFGASAPGCARSSSRISHDHDIGVWLVDWHWMNLNAVFWLGIWRGGPEGT